MPDARTMAVYRMMAESIYVRTTGRPIAIADVSLGAACTSAPCQPIAEQWGLEPLRWDAADSSAAREAQADLLARSRRPLNLRAVPLGQHGLVSTEMSAIPLRGSDVRTWITFRDSHGGAAGGISFSPVGFDSTGRMAIVFVDWRCGPDCGHQLRAALRSTDDSTWSVSDMLLLKSDQRP